MRLRLPIAFASALLAACAAIPPAPHAIVDRAPLLDGRELFGETVPQAQEADILELSAPMRTFLAHNGRNVQVDWLRMRRLLDGMRDAGYLDLTYENDKTLTAAETFAA